MWPSARDRQHPQSVTKSRGWLRSGFNRWLRRFGGTTVGGRSDRRRRAATGGARSGSTAGRSRSTAGLRSVAATNPSGLAATDLGLTAAASRFRVTTDTQHNRDRSSSRPTKHAIHPDLPQILDIEPNMAADPRHACLRSSTIPSRYAEDTLEDWGNCSEFPCNEVAEYRREFSCQTTRESFPNLGDWRRSSRSGICAGERLTQYRPEVQKLVRRRAAEKSLPTYKHAAQASVSTTHSLALRACMPVRAARLTRDAMESLGFIRSESRGLEDG